MRTSSYLKIDETLRLSRVYEMLIKKNRGPKDVYVLCTSPSPQNLFEIITCNQLTKKYEDSYLLGISKNKAWLIDYTVVLIDQMYNVKSLTYEMLKAK